MDEQLSDDFVDHNPIPGTTGNRAGMVEGLKMLFQAFPDLQSPPTFLLSDGDLVVGHHTSTGTHQGPFMDIPATGKSISVTEIHIVKFANGKAVEHWGLVDDMAMMQQLGVAPGGG